MGRCGELSQKRKLYVNFMIEKLDVDNDYIRYRGKCKEMVDSACESDPTLTPVRGHYICPIWGKQQHWWTVRADGAIYDPSCKQFPSKGFGDYVPFNGSYECSECGKIVKESEADIDGRYVFCSTKCHMKFVGL